jgi:hypothetical protein
MKKISAYQKKAGIIMVVVMSFHSFTGFGVFCADRSLASFKAGASGGASLTVTAPDDNNVDVSPGTFVNSHGKTGTLPCSCQKKKCPAIPRAAITSTPTHRLNEFQRLAKSECCDSLVSQVIDHHFVSRGNTPLLELAWYIPLYSYTPLALTCVLLI